MTARAWTLPLLLCALPASCSKSNDTASTRFDERGGPANFELRCDATSLPRHSEIHCVRHDTRNGDVKRVAVRSLAVAQAPTATTEGPPGTYQVACRATSSLARSDFFCVRLHTQTGEIALIPLKRVGVVPEGAEDPLESTPEPERAAPAPALRGETVGGDSVQPPAVEPSPGSAPE